MTLLFLFTLLGVTPNFVEGYKIYLKILWGPTGILPKKFWRVHFFNELTHFWSMFPFDTPWKQQKTKSFQGVWNGSIDQSNKSVTWDIIQSFLFSIAKDFPVLKLFILARMGRRKWVLQMFHVVRECE